MTEFERLRDEYRGAVAEMRSAELAVKREADRLKRLEAQEQALARRRIPQDADQDREAAELARSLEGTRSALKKARATVDSIRQRELETARIFASQVDPRESIGRWNDGTPILLLPVRLETRFKNTVRADGTSAHELWVRVFPDDCWLDGFDPTLTQSEIDSAKRYFTALWQAGGIEEQERAAWRALVESHGAGRAAWIIRQYLPSNVSEKPVKSQPEDVVLAVAEHEIPPVAERNALDTYWRKTWMAFNDAEALAAAAAELTASVGAVRADELIRTLRPANFDTPLPVGTLRSEVTVTVAWLKWPPEPETKQNVWSAAPQFNLLPERFAFVGYAGNSAPLVQLGGMVPSHLFAGPDPSAPPEEQLKHDDLGHLNVPDELKWLTDFDRAVEVGMGFRIPLSTELASRGFDRVIVVGLRLASDAEHGKSELERLLEHHAFSRSGLSLVPQGTPTNNTEATNAGHGRAEDSDESFDAQRQPLFSPTPNWEKKRDGQWLAEYLGLDPSFFVHTQHADATDQSGARAMNHALFPGTLGYWMQTMMAPVFSSQTREQVRRFFCDYVLASGAIPSIRIASQPYGILPATPWSRLGWFGNTQSPTVGHDSPGSPEFLQRLYGLISDVERDFRAQQSSVSFVGKSGDAHAILLDIIGLHSGSVEWSQRYAESLDTLYNRLALQGFSGILSQIVLALRQEAARNVLSRLGYQSDVTPKQLSLVFSGTHQELKGGVVDDRPLSEVERIRSYTSSGQNYLEWLVDAARSSLDALYRQDGFIGDKPPTALLYLILRYALQHGYHDTSLRLLVDAGAISQSEVLLAQGDDPFLHVRSGTTLSESRYRHLYASEPAVTGSATQTIGEFIGARLKVSSIAGHLPEQVAAIERLAHEPTARLERLFADHVDCCSYRLDAWRLGLQTAQICGMRNLRSGSATSAKSGVYLGAWGILEDLRPENKRLTPVRFTDPELMKDFGSEICHRDATNQGFIHAPSLNHAVAAAVLRNGYLSNASAEVRSSLAVNLSSERVRTALGLLEGIRAGQSLSDLLGYQFERGLHDRHGEAEVDKFIYKLRKAFPLRADRLKSTRTGEGVPIESVEARNVINGLSFVEHLQKTANFHYPFGKEGLPTATVAEAAAIDAEAQRLLDAHDAVADLAVSEGVYQAVLGNYDRVASTYDAYARGHFPPEPDIVRTPLNGTAITHRVAIHLPVGRSPSSSPWGGTIVTPRGQAEAALNHWLGTVLPRPEQVGCVVTFRDGATGSTSTREVTFDMLALQPIDWLHLLHDKDEQAMSELDDRILLALRARVDLRPDVRPIIGYLTKQSAAYSVFEMMPILRHLRALVTKSRPLRATDLSLMNEANSSQDSEPFIEPSRLVLPHGELVAARGALASFSNAVQLELDDLTVHRAALLAAFDDRISILCELLARVAKFGIPQAGWGFAYELQSASFSALLRRVDALVDRWDSRLATFDERITQFDTLPATASEAAKFRLLLLAEREISTVATEPLSTTPELFRGALVSSARTAFVARRDEIRSLRATTLTRVSDLMSAFAALLPIDLFDAEPFTLTENEAQVIRATEDMQKVVMAVIEEVDRRIAASQSGLDDHGTSGSARERTDALLSSANALFGEGFGLFPEFTLEPERGMEIANAVNASRSGELFQELTAPTDPSLVADEFPVDTWMYGLARVREKMFAWEQLVQLSGALGATEPELLACQLPYLPNDRWLGMDIPNTKGLLTDRLLYTAHFAVPFDGTARQCGLLIDEWTEVVPTNDVDTGIAFHFDRPNCEAPQTWLLLTPARFTGSWLWSDVIDGIRETMDLAKQRALEPKHVDALPYAPFLPASVMAHQIRELTLSANLALNNRIQLTLKRDGE
jgi:hypothetical protein